MVRPNETSLAELLYSNTFFLTLQYEKIGFTEVFLSIFIARTLERASVEL